MIGACKAVSPFGVYDQASGGLSPELLRMLWNYRPLTERARDNIMLVPDLFGLVAEKLNPINAVGRSIDRMIRG